MPISSAAVGTAPAEIERELVAGFLGDEAGRDEYRRELEASGLVEHLKRQTDLFWSTVEGTTARGQRYNTGRITGRDGYHEGAHLYAIVRSLKPQLAVETGVCNGVSTAFLLLGLQRNGSGALYSIDLPEVAGQGYEPDVFWDGKGGAVIPAGRQPGWMIPGELKRGWTLLLERSQHELPALLARLGSIDLFMHDSEHSYECMSFEFRMAYAALRPGGVLIADDIHSNTAFAEFAAEVRGQPIGIGPKMAFLVK